MKTIAEKQMFHINRMLEQMSRARAIKELGELIDTLTNIRNRMQRGGNQCKN